MKRAGIVFTAIVIILSSAFVWAAEKGSTKEAQAMVKKAVAYLKEKGNQDAFAEFSNPKGKFVDRDLYIYVLDMDRNSLMMAHGANKGLIGKEFQQLKDSDGKLFIQEINKKARAAGGGWVDYKWTNPVSKKVEPKTAYFEKYNNLVVICGAYK